jgi:SSS family solute:Na+ symporter
MLDFLIVIFYFLLIFFIALRGKVKSNGTAEEYFLSNRNLKWYSIALSTIATNVQGYQFLGMMGSAFLYGLAQANLEINAVQGILIATFVFVPIYLRNKIFTITEFIEKKLGKKIALFYSLTNIALFATITLGAALFWGAYAAEMVFGDQLSFLHSDRIIRIAILIVILAIFSATYTYFGGLNAVVKTDIIQFIVLLLGGTVVCVISINQLGGWEELYIKTPQKMNLHLPSDHPVLPWTHLLGLFFLNINYWCANQSIMQRAIAAKNLYHAQSGLMIGGVIKYFMAIIIVIPGIALYGILGDSFTEPDLAFPYLVKTYLPIGLKGIVLCGLFASLMSTIDSTFNSLATLWSVDIYSKYINKKASDFEKIDSGRKAIIVSFFTSLLMSMVLLYLKFDSPDSAFTHTLNNLRYYINCGIVVLICSALILIRPKLKPVFIGFILTLPMNILIQFYFPEINYFLRAFFSVVTGLSISFVFNLESLTSLNKLIIFGSKNIRNFGVIMLISLIIIHIIFH